MAVLEEVSICAAESGVGRVESNIFSGFENYFAANDFLLVRWSYLKGLGSFLKGEFQR